MIRISLIFSPPPRLPVNLSSALSPLPSLLCPHASQERRKARKPHGSAQVSQMTQSASTRYCWAAYRLE